MLFVYFHRKLLTWRVIVTILAFFIGVLKMIDLSTVDRIKKSPIEERIQIIELILQSLKNDIKIKTKNVSKTKFRQFKIRKFSLGEEVHVNRDEIYSERGF